MPWYLLFFYLFDQYTFNVITERCYVFMYLCVEIINCLLFTVFLQYTSLNDFSRIDKIKIVKSFEKIKFKLRIICFLLEFTPGWCSCNSFQSVLLFLNSCMATILYWIFFPFIFEIYRKLQRNNAWTKTKITMAPVLKRITGI